MSLRVCVLSLTRDRLPFTQHCFASLRENAGCDYTHVVWDNGSTDGTPDWLFEEADAGRLQVLGAPLNVGISRALNDMLDYIGTGYDVVVKFDNDCELTTPDTLAGIAYLVHTYGLLLSPVIGGLRHPPKTLGRPISLGGQLVDEKSQIGGIFLAAPASLYDGFRFSESNPVWGGDDVEICAHHRADGGQCGYVRDYHANHYLGTDAQAEQFPEYFERRVAEGGPAR